MQSGFHINMKFPFGIRVTVGEIDVLDTKFMQTMKSLEVTINRRM